MAVIVEAPSGVPMSKQQQQKPGNTVYVGNIPYQCSEQQVKDLCGEIGPVVSFRMIVDKDTGKPKGYGFCEFLDEETALSACRNLNGATIGGRQLRVNLSSKAKSFGVVGAAPLACNVGIRIGGPGYVLPSFTSCVNVTTQTQEEQRGQENRKLGELIGFLARNYSQETLCGLLANMLGMPENHKEAVLALCPHLLNALFQAVPLANPQAAFFSAAQPPPHQFQHLWGCGQKRTREEDLDLDFHPQQKGEATTAYTPTTAVNGQGSPEMFSEEPHPPKRLKMQLDDDQEQSPLQPSTPPHTQEPITCRTAHKRPAQHQLLSPTDHLPLPMKRARLQDEDQPPLHLTSQLLDYLLESVKNASI